LHSLNTLESLKQWQDKTNHEIKLGNPKLKRAWKLYVSMHMVFETQKSKVEKSSRKLYVLAHMGFKAKKSKVEESLKTICAEAHGFQS